MLVDHERIQVNSRNPVFWTNMMISDMTHQTVTEYKSFSAIVTQISVKGLGTEFIFVITLNIGHAITRRLISFDLFFNRFVSVNSWSQILVKNAGKGLLSSTASYFIFCAELLISDCAYIWCDLAGVIPFCMFFQRSLNIKCFVTFIEMEHG